MVTEGYQPNGAHVSFPPPGQAAQGDVNPYEAAFPKGVVVQPGDCFCSTFPGGAVLPSLIRFVSTLQASDLSATYTHAGIITDSLGGTFESRWTAKRQNLYREYLGKPVLIARPLFDLTSRPVRDTVIGSALSKIIESHEGEWYPVLRMPLHVLGLAKFIHWHFVVCSELVAKFLYLASIRHRHYFGTKPDTLADEFKNYRCYKVIFEGVLTDDCIPRTVKLYQWATDDEKKLN